MEQLELWNYCEECEVEIPQVRYSYFCDDCYENYHCECGQRLEDSYGSPGDGFCIKCR